MTPIAPKDVDMLGPLGGDGDPPLCPPSRAPVPKKPTILAGRPKRLVDAPVPTPSVQELLDWALKTSGMDSRFCHLAPRIVAGLGLCLASPYSSQLQLANCLRLHYDRIAASMTARLGPVVCTIEPLVPLLPSFMLELEGLEEDVIIFLFEVAEPSQNHLLVCDSDAALLVDAAEMTRHLQQGFLLLGPRGLILPCTSTSLLLPPRPAPVPADDAAVQLAQEDAEVFSAAVRLGLPLPLPANRVKIRWDADRNELQVEATPGLYVSVGW